MSLARTHSRGISLIGFLVFLLLAYGVYAFFFKPPAAKPAAASVGASARAEPPKVVIYTVPSCDSCNRAKTWMTQRRVAFEERNVESSLEYEQELTSYKASIVPVIVVNGQPLYGFQSAHLEAALKDAAGPKK